MFKSPVPQLVWVPAHFGWYSTSRKKKCDTLLTVHRYAGDETVAARPRYRSAALTDKEAERMDGSLGPELSTQVLNHRFRLLLIWRLVHCCVLDSINNTNGAPPFTRRRIQKTGVEPATTY